MDQGEEPVERPGHGHDFLEQPRRLARFLDLGVGQLLDGLHRHRRARSPVERLVEEERTALGLRLVERLARRAAEEAVAATQVVIEKAERSAGREGVQPQRHLGQLHRHRIAVHAVDAALEHHAPHDAPVVEAVGVHRPAALRGVPQDGATHLVDAFGDGRGISRSTRFRFRHGGDYAVGEVVDETDQEVSRAHRRVADAQGEDGLARVQLHQRSRTIHLAEAAGRRMPGPLGEAIEPGLHQRLDRLPEDEADEIGGREVAAGRPAHERVRADDDIIAVPHKLAFEQSLVDRTELLHAEVPVVDVAPAGGGLLERQRVDDVRHDAVAQPDRAEQRGPLPVEQPAVVGRKTDRRVALVDDPAQIVDGGPVARGVGGERIAFVLAPPDVVAHPRPEAVVVVAGVAHREQFTVLGVEDEQEPVEERQGRVPHLRQRRVGSGGGDGAGEIGENAVEDQLRQARGDALLVVRPLVDGPLMERPGIRGAREEGVAPEDQDEQTQHMTAVRLGEGEQPLVAAWHVEHGGEIDLEELLRNGTRSRMVEPPAPAVGEDAPAAAARRQVVHSPQVTQHLRGRRGARASVGTAVERQGPTFRLDDGETQPIASPLFVDAVGAALGRLIRKEQAVGYILRTLRRQVLLAQARRPPQPRQHGPDQVVLGLALVRPGSGREAVEERPQVALDPVDGRVVERAPLVEPGDGIGEEITREQRALEHEESTTDQRAVNRHCMRPVGRVADCVRGSPARRQGPTVNAKGGSASGSHRLPRREAAQEEPDAPPRRGAGPRGSDEQTHRLQLLAEHLLRVGVPQELLDEAGVDAAEVDGVLQVVAVHELGEARGGAVLAALDPAADDERDVGGAVVGAEVGVLGHAAAELAVDEDGHVVLLAEALHLLEEGPDRVRAVLHLPVVRALLVDVGVEQAALQPDVVEPGREVVLDQRHDLVEVEQPQVGVAGAAVVVPGLADEGGGVAGAPVDVEQELVGGGARLLPRAEVVDVRLLGVEDGPGERGRLVEDDRDVLPGPHREALGRRDVDEVVGRPRRVEGVGGAAVPAVLGAAVGGAGCASTRRT